MSYALVQKELNPLAVEPLARAFRAWPALTELDAQHAAHDTFGILLRGLELEAAQALQAALQQEEIETEIVEQAALPVMPPPRLIRAIEFLPTHVTLVDPLKRHVELPWTDLLLLAAGNVRLTETRRVKNTLDEPVAHGAGISQDLGAGTRAKEEQRFHFVLDLLPADTGTRYSILADDFSFDCLGSDMTLDLPENFRRLVREIERHAPHASLNRGAYEICKVSDDILPYPGKPAFADEMVWMLWRIARAQAQADGE